MNKNSLVQTNVDLTPYNSYGLRARCARAFFPNSEEEVYQIFDYYPTPSKIWIGSGHNIILAREWYEEDFIIFNGTFNSITVHGSVMEVQAGAFSAQMSEVALQHGLSGLEFICDIPSSLGGAIVMNAGAGGEEIGGLLISVRYLDLNDLTVHEVDAQGASLSYRNSLFQRDSSKIVLSAELQLQPGCPKEIKSKMDQVRSARWAKQPREYPNAGSVFKRPKGRYVGPMIEALGLKGVSVGGFQVSSKHAGFIIRNGHGTACDLLSLIEKIQSKVYNAYGVRLEMEQQVVA